MKKVAMALFLVLFLVLFAVPAMAETYTWTDERGTVNFTEDLGKVPKKFRKKARLIGEYESDAPPPMEAPPEQKPAAGAEPKVAAPASSKDPKDAQYGGKDGAEWSREFSQVRNELKSSEGQLVDTRKRMDDTSTMSRNEYLSLQLTIRNMERRVVELRKRLTDLEAAATQAEVPRDLWQ